jgi:hypothetical protein
MKRSILVLVTVLISLFLADGAQAKHRHYLHHHYFHSHLHKYRYVPQHHRHHRWHTVMRRMRMAFQIGAPHLTFESSTELHEDFAQSTYLTDVTREAMKYIGRGNITGKRGAWCRWFVNMVLERTGHRLADTSGLAHNSYRLGPRTSPHPGAIAYNWRHVGFVLKVRGSSVLLISGNHGHRVGIGWYSGMSFVNPS